MAYGVMEPKDLVQETILVVLQNWDKIQKKDSLLAFMISVAANRLKMQNRKLKHQTRLELEKEAIKTLESKTQSPELAYDIHMLYKAMDQLPTKEKECLVLFEISGFSIKEISDIINEGESAIKTRLSRTRQKLRQMLEDKLPHPEKPAKISTIFHSIALL